MIDEDEDEEENYQVDFDEDDDDDDNDVSKGEESKPAGGGLTRVPGSSHIQKLGDKESDTSSDKFNDVSDLQEKNLSPNNAKVVSP
jgi:hypothetical protein